MSKVSDRQRIDKLLNSSDGAWGVYAKNLSFDTILFAHNENLEFPAASIAKVSIALYVFHQVSTQNLSFDETVSLDKNHKLGGSGILEHLHSGLNLTILDVVKLMLLVSDNTAAKLLVKKCTPQKINSFLKQLGLKSTKLKIDGDTFGYGLTTPKEMSTMLEGLYKHRYFNSQLSKKFLEIMKQSQSDLGVRRYLPHDRYDQHAELEISSKGGRLPGVRSEVAIVFGQTPYVISIFSKDLKDKSYKPDNKGLLIVAQTAKLVHELALSD